MSADTFITYVNLRTDKGYKPASPVSGTADEQMPNDEDTTVNHESTAEKPFWGIWSSAYKNRQNAEKDARELVSKGYTDAQVIVTTDWSNLNTEKWYVVTVARCSSKEEAKKMLPEIQASVDASAYVKYTGDRKQ